MMKTKTKLKRENRKDWKRKRKRKCQNSKTCHSTKVLAYNTALTGDRPTAVRHESVTNSGRYLGMSSTRLRQQVW